MSCTDHSLIIDDYRESWAVIRGRVVGQDDQPVRGATVRAIPLRPLHAQGDSVTSAADGSYLVRVTSFGVSSFRADVRIRVTSPTGGLADTVVTNLHVAEEGRGGRPDTLILALRVR